MLDLREMSMSQGRLSEAIIPAFFGQDSNLYGCYHLSDDARQERALVICQPSGHEYERCHRAMRQLGVQSVRSGFSAMRFDYYSTGDSAGDGEDLSLAQMRRDIKQAVRSCCERTGARRVTLVGLRLGATLAAQVASDCIEVDSLVLYAPVFDGEILMLEWQDAHRDFGARHGHLKLPSSDTEILGFPLPAEFRNELDRQFSPQSSSSAIQRILVLSDQAEPDSALLLQWIETFKRQGIEVAVETAENIAIWRREPMEAIVPIKAIRRIVKWVGEEQDD